MPFPILTGMTGVELTLQASSKLRETLFSSNESDVN